MMAESVQTRPGNPSRLEQVYPMVTELASLDERDVIHGRQDIYQDCGFFQYNDNTSGRVPFFPLILLPPRPVARPRTQVN